MTNSGSLSALLAALLSILIYYLVTLKPRSRLRLPPGPKSLPIFGNIFDLPQVKPWVVYHDWSLKYHSDVIFLNLPNQPTIILNSSRAILDLLEGRSRNYADKPEMVMDDLTGWTWNFALMPYGSRWRNTRRTFHQYFNQPAVKHYHPIQAREIRVFLMRAASLAGAERVDAKLLGQILAAIILDIVYGIRIHSFNEEFVSLSQKAMEAITLGKLPGAFWAEYFPWLRYIPAWVPGSSARKFGDRYKPTVEAVRSKPFDAVMQDVMNGIMVPSVAQQIAQKLQEQSLGTDQDEYQEEIAKNVTGIAYAGAVDTQLSVLSSFLLAMTTMPHVQRKAQEMLDSVIGPGRLPTVEDLPSLPYIEAIYLEALRWMPVLPLGVPRRAIKDDEYNGYSIPAGTTIVANVWAMLHDPVEYPEPEVFNPDRFLRNGALNPDVREPTAAFGFGRRICAGRHLVKDTVPLMIASILHVFNIEPTDENISEEPTTGFLTYPKSLPCRLVPGNAAVLDVINSELDLN